jgi:Tol biopolymer transport system component
MRLHTRMLVLPIVLATTSMNWGRSAGPEYTHLFTLKAKEGVFAYARISPDGRVLVYGSEQSDARHPRGIRISETVVDLATRKVLFSEEGIDAYWSTDGGRIIYSGNEGVSLRDMKTGTVSGNIAPPNLGDYYSWASRDGKDLIMTIDSKYYYLKDGKAVLPASSVTKCDKIGTGERPLISKDGTRITTFVDGNIVVRGIDNCDNIFDTGIKGAKADFSWDGRYIAFHSLKPRGSGYDIQIVDLQKRTIRTLPGLKGSALFPSWTRDGRLAFRYDGPDYRGFMMASGVLDIPARPLPTVVEALPADRGWKDIFAETPRPEHHVNVVMIWAPWSAHSQLAFTQLDRARDYFASENADVSIAAAADPGSAEQEITRQWSAFETSVPRVALSSRGLAMTQARNQMPTTLLFRDGVLVGEKLGAQTATQLREWIEGAAHGAR